jgi:uncharacterized protein
MSFLGHWDTFHSARSRCRMTATSITTLPLEDGDFVKLVYFSTPVANKIVLILPGMAGNANSPVVQSCCVYWVARGYCPVVLEFRNCSAVVNKTKKFYNAGSVSDLNVAVRHLSEHHSSPLSRIIGFSLGAINLVHWAAEYSRERHRVEAIDCFSIAPSLLDIAERANMGINRIYQAKMLDVHRKMLIRRTELLLNVPVTRLARINTMLEFDELITVPMNGFLSLQHYYDSCSAEQYLDSIEIPCRIFNAKNDPLIPLADDFPNRFQNSYLSVYFRPRGGHLGRLNSFHHFYSN